MKILWVTHTGEPSGAELAMLATLQAFPDPTAIHAIVGAGPLGPKLGELGLLYETIDSGSAGLRAKLTAKRASSALKALGKAAGSLLLTALRTKPDIMVANSLRAGLLLTPAAIVSRTPLVWYVRDRLAADYLSRKQLLLVRQAMRYARGFIANSAATAATIPRRSSQALLITPSPVTWTPKRPVQTRPWTVALVGRLTSWKGQMLFVDAFNQAFAQGSERALIVGEALFGEASYRSELERRIEELHLAERVKLLGHRDDVPDLLASEVDVLAHSSLIPEPFGQVIAQGMSTGLPVVAADAGGPREMITDGKNGLLYAMGSSSALADALRDLRCDPTKAGRLGREAEKSAGLYDSRVVAQRIHAYLRSTLEPKQL